MIRAVAELGSLAIAILGIAAVGVGACGGEPSASGVAEPLLVRAAVFKKGTLPGEAPLPQEQNGPPPNVTFVDVANPVLYPAQSGKTLAGRTSTDAVAIAVRLVDLGTGYWVLPVDAPDPAANGELTWKLDYDVGSGLPAGPHALRIVAIDAAGHAGTQREVKVCVASAVPDFLHACDRAIAPPAAVFSLSWDSNTDVDLVVVTPDGKTVDAKHPSTVSNADGGVDRAALASPRTGILDRDSNGACVIDSARRENLIFKEAPLPGTYLVYASLFQACGVAPAHFHFGLWESQPGETPETKTFVETVRKNGVLLDTDANGGRTLGTFVTEISFP